MKISDTAVRRPVTIVMITVLFVGLAAYLIPSLAVDLLPSVDFPAVVVVTSDPGTSPGVMEQNITEVLERMLSGVSGLDTITSTSSKGTSIIQLLFDYGTDLDRAVGDIRDVLEQASWFLPDGVQSPSVLRFDVSMMPIMQLRVQGRDETLGELYSIAEDYIQPNLERVSGVASVNIQGGQDQIILVDVDLDRMIAHNVSLDQITGVLRSSDYAMDYGELELGGLVYTLTGGESLTSLRQIERLVVMEYPDGGIPYPIRIGDIAEVSFGTSDHSTISRVDGNEALTISITNESGANSVQVASMVTQQLDVINGLLPGTAAVSVLYDTTTLISATLNEVIRAAIQGMFLAMAVLFLFLRNIRSTVIIGLAIPISLAVTLMGMYFFGMTLNIITMTGLILALGMTVDNSIVILENIYRYRERGTKLRSSAILGSREMINAITTSTLTTIVAFVPMIIWRDDLGLVGQLFQDLIFTVVLALAVSLLVAAAVVPALGSKFIKIHTRTQYPLKNRVLRAIDSLLDRFFKGIDKGYCRMLSFTLSNKALVLTLTAVILVLSVVQLTTMGMNLFPPTSSDDSVSLSITMPPGTSLGRNEEVAQEMIDIIQREVEGYEHLVMNIGSGGMMGFGGGSNTTQIQIILPPLGEQTVSAQEVQNTLRPFITLFPDAEIEFSAGRTMGTSAPVDVEIRSESLDLAAEVALEVRDLLIREVPQVVDPVSSMEQGGPVYEISLNRESLSAYGVNASYVNSLIRNYMSGVTGGTFSENGSDIDIKVQLKSLALASLSDFRNLPIPLRSGDIVPLQALGEVNLTTGPISITRENRERVIHVTGGLREGVTVTEIQPIIQNTINENMIIPDGVSIDFAGEILEMEDFGEAMFLIILVAIFMVFVVMASQFESLVDPLIIFFSIPLMIVGVVSIFVLVGEPFSLYATVGMVVLAGIVVNNGIVLVDYTNLQLRRGVPLRKACLVAAESRLRPILMTSLTTILSMVPLAFFPGEGMEMVQPVGKTIVGGLAVSTIMTLFVTPSIYMIVNTPGERRRKKLEQKRKSVKESRAVEV